MNWNLFWAVLGLGLTAALINLRRELSPVEAWSLVLSRAVAAGLLAYFLPEQVNGVTIAALGVWEGAQVTAGLITHAVLWTAAKKEGHRWLAHYNRLEMRRAEAPRTPDDTFAP